MRIVKVRFDYDGFISSDLYKNVTSCLLADGFVRIEFTDDLNKKVTLSLKQKRVIYMQDYDD
ncbi:MAG: hypothetical protein GY928_20560 [Colwellia sp.]|nr:hypothetical protein [Colwellia sp.]